MIANLLSLAALAVLQVPGQSTAPQEETVYMGRAFLFQANLEHGRAAGWCSPDADRDAVLDHIARQLEVRLRSTGRFVEATVAREPEGALAVTFVGRQAQSIEEMLRRGLSHSGRIEYAALATGEKLTEMGIDLANEKERLVAWREKNPEAPLSFFNTVAVESGGPNAELRWAQPKGEGAPVLLLRARSHLFGRSQMKEEQPLEPIVHPEQEGELAVRVHLTEEAQAQLRATLEPHLGQKVATLVNDRVVRVRVLDALPEESTDVVGDLTRDEVRSLIWGLAAEPFGAPLRFTGFGKRELSNVKPHEFGDTD